MTPTAHRRSKPHTRGSVPGSESPDAALEPKIYVLKGDWLDVLAGDDESLRTRATGRPMATVISTLAGLDRTHLGQVEKKRLGGTGLSLSLKVMEALITFLEARRGMTEEQARNALFELVPARSALTSDAQLKEIALRKIGAVA